MKKKVSLLVGLLYSLLGLSQADDISATIEWSELIYRSHVDIIHADSVNLYYAGIVFWGSKPYDDAFGKIKVDDLEKEIEITKEVEKFNDAYPEIIGYKVKGNELHGFYTHYDKQADIKSIMVRKVIDENKKMGDYKTIGSIESSRSDKATLTYEWSENDSILMLIGNPERETKSDNEAVEFKVLDYNYDLIYECRIELDFQDRYFNLVSYQITNSGQIWMLGYKIPNKRKGEKVKKRESNETYYLYVYDVDKDELIEYDLGLKDKFITNLELRTDFEGNKSVIYGIYSDQGFNGMAGSFYLSIDQTNYEVVSKKFNPFDKEFIKLLTDKKSEKEKVEKGKQEEVQEKNFVLKDIIQKKDGGYLVVFENYRHWIEIVHSSNGSTSTTRYFEYDEIFVQNYTPDGDVLWTAFIPKYQYTLNDDGRYSGYMLVVEEDKLHFIYNDHKKNESRWGTDEDLKGNRFMIKSNYNLVAVTLTEEGDLSYRVLMPSRIEKFTFCPRHSKILGKNSNKAIISANNTWSTRFGTIELVLD